MSNFSFLPTEFRTIEESAARAEGHIMGDPRAACFHARFALESVVHWLYRHDAALRMPYDQSLGALIDQLTARGVMDASALYEPPFNNLHAGGPDELFAGKENVINAVFQVFKSFEPQFHSLAG